MKEETYADKKFEISLLDILYLFQTLYIVKN